MKTIDIQGSPYVKVNERLIYFNEHYKDGRITTDLVEMTERYIVKATIIPDVSNSERYFTGYAEEVVGSSQVNKTSALENCETSAVGRGLAMMGIGIIKSIASAEEVANAVHQQNGVSQVSASVPTNSENNFKCPLCEDSIIDQRVFGEDGVSNPLSQNGKPLPAFKCVKNDDPKNPTCKFVSWKLDEVEAGLIIIDEAPHKVLVDDANLAKAEQMAQEAEGLTF